MQNLSTAANGVNLPPMKNKQQITLRIDKDSIDWYRSHGKFYQRLMNTVLRQYMIETVKQLDLVRD